MAQQRQQIKCVITGDRKTGKTALVVTYCTKQFPQPDAPNNFNLWLNDLVVDDKPFQIGLWDEHFWEDWKYITGSFSQTDVFITCFSISDPTSFYDVSKVWHPEITRHCPHTPIIVVGTKSDLRADQVEIANLAEKGITLVSAAQGNECLNLGGNIKKYMECSAKTQEGLQELIEEAIRIALAYPVPVKKSRCVLS